MALQWCNRHVVWLRRLLVEMGYSDMVSDPTVVRGDNTAANQLCYEDNIISNLREPVHNYALPLQQGGGNPETGGREVRQIGRQPGRSNYQSSGQDHKCKAYR